MVSVAVSDIAAVMLALEARGIAGGPIKPEGDAGLKAVVVDPDGNSISILQVPSGP